MVERIVRKQVDQAEGWHSNEYHETLSDRTEQDVSTAKKRLAGDEGHEYRKMGFPGPYWEAKRKREESE